MTLRNGLRDLLTQQIRTLVNISAGALVSTDTETQVEVHVHALRQALQQWEALVRAIQTDGRPAIYAIPNVLGEEYAELHRQAQAYIARLETIFGVTQASAQ